MKKMITIMLVVLLALPFFSACKGGKGNSGGDGVVGKWHIKRNDYMVLGSDGTYRVTNKAGSATEEKGKYVLKGKEMNFTSSSGEKRTFKVIKITASRLTIAMIKRGKVRGTQVWKKVK